MKYIDLAQELITDEAPFQEISVSILLEAKRIPVAAFWPQGNEIYKAGIIVPSIDIEDSINFVNTYVSNDPTVILTIENLLKEKRIIKSDETMSPKVFAIFSIYHELGHWHDYQNRYASKGLNGNDFFLDHKKEEDKLGLSEIGNRAKNEAKGSPGRLELSKLYHQTYRENPFEKIADDYAIKRLEEYKMSLS